MEKKLKAPFEIVLVIVKRGMAEMASEILKRNGSNFHLISMAEGTAVSSTAEFFGFGMNEREILFGLVDVSYAKSALKILNDELNLEEPSNGIAVTMPITSATSVMLEMCVKGLTSGGNDGK